MTKSPNRPRFTTYDVGYGKPPKDTRFQPGVSGNPKGRPKGSRNLPPQPMRVLEQIIVESRRLVKITEGGETKEVPTATALLLALKTAAFKGDVPAQRSFLHLARIAEGHEQDRWEKQLDEAISYKTEGLRRLASADEPMIPDPRDMIITDDCIMVNGPNTPDEKRRCDEIQEELARLGRSLGHAERRLKSKDVSPEAPKVVRQLRREIAVLEGALASFVTVIRSPYSTT